MDFNNKTCKIKITPLAITISTVRWHKTPCHTAFMNKMTGAKEDIIFN